MDEGKLFLSYYPYRSPRPGALLRCELRGKNSGQLGYSDYCPLATDPPLLQALAESRRPELLERSLYFAVKMASKRDMFTPLDAAPESHFLISSIDKLPEQITYGVKLGCRTFKIKMKGGHFREELLQLASLHDLFINRRCLGGLDVSGFRYRLDLNSSSNEQEFFPAWREAKEFVSQVEYVEDPFPFTLTSWQGASALAPLAIDFEKSNVSSHEWPLVLSFVKAIVIKPAVEVVSQWLDLVRENASSTERPLISVTSYRDHALGVLHAAQELFEASKAAPDFRFTGGFLRPELVSESQGLEPLDEVLTAKHARWICQSPAHLTQVLQSLPWQDWGEL